MMARIAPTLLAAALSAAAVGSHAQQPAPAGEVIGTWINPHHTVKVQTGNCAGKLCGWIIWAAPQAQADARDSGVSQLVGVELLRDYRNIGAGHYRGEVYVPDMGRTFYSRIEQANADTLTISGCIMHGLICRSQQWHRV